MIVMSDSSFYIGGLVFSPLAGAYMAQVGRKNTILLGYFILVRDEIQESFVRCVCHSLTYVDRS